MTIRIITHNTQYPINSVIALDPLEEAALISSSDAVDATAIDGFPQIESVYPTGFNDTANFIAAFTKNNGVLTLAPGDYYISPTVLTCQRKWRNDTTDWRGPKIVCAGGVANIYPVGSAPITNTRVDVQAITLGATTSFRCDAHPFVNGDKVIVQMPSYIAAGSSFTPPATFNFHAPVGNTVERLSGKTCYVQVTDANNVQLFSDAALTQAINSTGWGAQPADMNLVKLRRYSDDRTVNYTGALLRITGPLSLLTGKYESIMGTQIINVNIIAATNFVNGAPSYPLFYARQGIGIAIEAMGVGTLGAAGNSSPSQGNTFINCEISGWDAAVLLDDCTNNFFLGCNFQNNNNALWKGWNIDITTYQQCRFGDDTILPGQPLQEVSAYTPLSYRPGSSAEAPGSASIENYEGCWFMSVLGISLFRSTNGAFSGALGSQSNASNIINIRGCYAELVRKLVDVNMTLNVNGLHIGNFKRDANLTNGDCVFVAYGGGQKTNVSLLGITSDGTGIPLNGWVFVADQIGANERYVPTVYLSANNMYGHVLRNNNGRRLFIRDGVNQSDQASGTGQYVFEGMLQVAGKTRSFKRTEAAATPSFTPFLFDEGYQHIVAGIAGALTVANPRTDSFTAATFAADFNFGANALYHLRMLPLEIIVTQDAVGGRTVSFGTDYVVDAANVTSGGANTMAKYVFEFGANGKWNQVSKAATWS